MDLSRASTPLSRYVTAPNFDPEASLNDLKRVCEGIEDIDQADHTRYVCHHMKEDVQFAPRKVCQFCFTTGVDRVRAVASGAYCISKNHVINNTGLLSFGVIYQTERKYEGEENNLSTCHETFVSYCKEDISVILRLLSINSSDIDPRMICLDADIFWSIIWFYGSVTKALKEIGGEKLYNKGFGIHEVYDDTFHELGQVSDEKIREHGGDEDPENLLGKLTEIFRNKVGLNSDTDLSSKMTLIEDNFVSTMQNRKRQWRYCCKNTSCHQLEDSDNFKSCGGCKISLAVKYCSIGCQREHWSEHKLDCKSVHNQVNNSSKQTKGNRQ